MSRPILALTVLAFACPRGGWALAGVLTSPGEAKLTVKTAAGASKAKHAR